MPGALDVASAGISSSLEPANRELGSMIHNLSEWADHPSAALLFDPQTSGGLLVGVDKSLESEFCQAMERAGVPGCHRIGSTHNREAGIMLTGKTKEVF
jgi:selenide,water dikinase